MMRLAVIEYPLIHKSAIVIAVDTPHWKGYVGGRFGKALDDVHLFTHWQRHAFGPTRGNVGGADFFAYYLLLTGGAALFTIAVARYMHRLRNIFLLLDAVGPVVFSVIGCNVALNLDMPVVVVIASGMIIGCVGDILCSAIPLLFRAELYTTVSITTGRYTCVAWVFVCWPCVLAGASRNLSIVGM